MTIGQALYQFFSSFGIDAYKNTAVPDPAQFPYLTYEEITNGWDQRAAITVNLWYYTESEAEPNAKATEIYNRIGHGGITLKCDDGVIWLQRGTPWCQSLTDDTDHGIKRRYINVSVHYLTTN